MEVCQRNFQRNEKCYVSNECNEIWMEATNEIRSVMEKSGEILMKRKVKAISVIVLWKSMMKGIVEKSTMNEMKTVMKAESEMKSGMEVS